MGRALRAERVGALDRGRLRVAMWGASPAARATLELMAATFPQAEIVSAYGQTEMAGATTLLKGADAVRKMGSVGRPMLGVELRVVDDDLRDVPDGAVGEIVYRGPDRHGGLPRRSPTRAPRPSPAAGSTAATSPRATRRAISGWSTARRT